MITDTIDAVLKAEQEAKEIAMQTSDEAKRIMVEAEAQADGMRKSVAEEIAVKRAEAVAKAEKEGDEEYKRVVYRGEKSAKEFERGCDITKASEFIVEKVLNVRR